MDSGVHIRPGDVVLDKYRVERVIGNGGMGFVVAARHVALEELFAIKLMLPSFAADPEAQERFLREARAAARLKGDHVAKVQDVGCLPDGTSYMVMEYLEGEDLKKMVRKNGPLPVDLAVEYTLQACRALREAHALGIVHRDVKLANLMLAPLPDGGRRVKVIDFGISKHTAAVLEDLTTNNWTGGSPLYMAPEQIRSAKRVDARADVWSIGIVLYELLTGTTPFRATSIAAVMNRVLYDDPVPVANLREGVPPALGDVVLRCLAKHPDDRFQSISELMEALSSAVAREALPPGEGTARPARASLLSIPYDTSALGGSLLYGSLASVTAQAPQRPSSTEHGFTHVASTPPAAGPGATTPGRRALHAAVVVAVLVLSVSGVGLLWLRLGSEWGPALDGSPWTSAAGAPAPGGPPVAAAPAPAAPEPPAASAPVVSVLLVKPASTVKSGAGASASGVVPPTSPPKSAPGESGIPQSKQTVSKKDPARPAGTGAAAAGPSRRKPEPLY